MAIRFIDAGLVPHLRSQSLYHGLAYAWTDATPDTVVLATPADPYVCIGFHQDLEHELDIAFCREQGLPIVRRETGGGAVYLDRDQLFVQWIMAGTRLPARIETRFELFARPLVGTYRELGIDAQFRPLNDVHVDGKKIVGTGAAHIGNADVLVGNFIFDFDVDVMARVLRAPSEAFRDQVRESLRRYMTSILGELGTAPRQSDVAAIYKDQCERVFADRLEHGELTDTELSAIEEVERRFLDDDFVHQPGGLRRPGVKIHEDVHVAETVFDTGGDSIRITARLRAGRILEEVSLASARLGDTFGLALALRGVELAPDPVRRALENHCDGRPARDMSTWLQAILSLRFNPENATP